MTFKTFQDQKPPQDSTGKPLAASPLSQKAKARNQTVDGVYQNLKLQMNQGKVMSNILCALMEKPGFASLEAKDTPALIREMYGLIKESTELVLKAIPSLKESQVIRAILYEPISECVKLCWENFKKKPEAKEVADIYMAMFNNPVIIPEKAFEDIDGNMVIEMKASSGAAMCLGPLLALEQKDPEKKGYAALMLGKNMQFKEYPGLLKKMIADKAGRKIKELCPPYLSKTEKSVFKMSVFNRVGELFAKALRTEFAQLEKELEQIQKSGPAKQKEYLAVAEKSPAGVLIDRAESVADKMITGLYAVSFVPQKQGPDNEKTDNSPST